MQAVHVTNQTLIHSVRPDAGSRIIGGYMVFYSAGSSLGALGSSLAYAAAGWPTCHGTRRPSASRPWHFGRRPGAWGRARPERISAAFAGCCGSGSGQARTESCRWGVVASAA